MPNFSQFVYHSKAQAQLKQTVVTQKNIFIFGKTICVPGFHFRALGNPGTINYTFVFSVFLYLPVFI